MSNRTKRTAVRCVATAVSVISPLAATLSQFPIWVNKGSVETISGCFLILVFICCIPFIRQIKAYMKSPSAPVIWGVLLVLFCVLRTIINQMLAVCAVGLIANLIGMGLYKFADYMWQDSGKYAEGRSNENGGGA